MQNPVRRFFESHLEEGEQVYDIVHKHWFVVIHRMVKAAFFGFVIPYAIYFVLPYTLVFWGMVLVMIYAAVRLVYGIFNWYLDVWLLTTTSIIDVRWDGFFKRSAQRVEYASIEQVSYAYKGVFQTILNYGTLHIQQPGGVDTISNIVNPKKIASDLTIYQEKLAAAKKFGDEDTLKDILTGLIHRYIQKHGINVQIDDQ